MPAEGGRRADPAGTTLKTPAKAQPPLVAPRAGDPMGGPARAVSSSLTQTPRFPPPSLPGSAVRGGAGEGWKALHPLKVNVSRMWTKVWGGTSHDGPRL